MAVNVVGPPTCTELGLEEQETDTGAIAQFALVVQEPPVPPATHCPELLHPIGTEIINGVLYLSVPAQLRSTAKREFPVNGMLLGIAHW